MAINRTCCGEKLYGGNFDNRAQSYELPITMDDGVNAETMAQQSCSRTILSSSLSQQLMSLIEGQYSNVVGIYIYLRRLLCNVQRNWEINFRLTMNSVLTYLDSLSDNQLVEVCTLSREDPHILRMSPWVPFNEMMEILENYKCGQRYLLFTCLNILLKIVPWESIEGLEIFKLKMIHRSLQIPLLKLDALKEIAQILNDFTECSLTGAYGKHNKCLTGDMMAKWIQENKVVSMIVHSFYQLEMWLPQREDTKEISENQLEHMKALPYIEMFLFFVITRKILTRDDVFILWSVLKKWKSELEMDRRIHFLRKETSPNTVEREILTQLQSWLRKPDYHQMSPRDIIHSFILCGHLLTFEEHIFLTLNFKYSRLFKFKVDMSSSDLCNKGNTDLIMMAKQVLQKSGVLEKEREKMMERISRAQLSVVNEAGKCEKRSLRGLEEKFMRDNYKDAETNPYYWDLGFARDQSGDQALLDKDELSPFGKPKPDKSKIKSNSQINGDEAEMKVFNMLIRTLKKANIPSSVLGRYKYNQHLAQYLQICKSFGIKFKGGDIDVLLSIPRTGIFVIEVKGISEYNIEKFRADKGYKRISPLADRVKHALDQCERSVQVLAEVNCDIFSEENCTFFKVVALPNVSKQSIERQFCPTCCSHFICKEDLKSTKTVLRWIRNISNGNESKLKAMCKGYDGHIYKRVKGRLVTQAFI